MPDQFWEPVDDANQKRDVTTRSRVPGGWIYRNIVWHGNNASLSVAMVFVPEASQAPAAQASSFAVGRSNDRQGAGD